MALLIYWQHLNPNNSRIAHNPTKNYLCGVENQQLTVKNLHKHYPGNSSAGISSISFGLDAGQILAIIGESGSGKSTLLKCIYGLLKPDEGEVLFDGGRVLGPGEVLIPGHPAMKMVTQDFSLNIYAKVYDNIAAMLSNRDLKLKENKTLAVMEHLHIAHLRDKKVVELSGGEQQRVAIAKALVSDTKMLLMDEPFSQVDAVLKNQLRADIKQLAKNTGVAIIIVSHDVTDGLFMADKLLILKDGQLLQQGVPQEVYQNPQQIYTAKMLGNANVLNTEQAEALGIKIKTGNLVFYPEWVELKNNWNSRRFEVLDVYYKGFYDELLLVRHGVKIRALQLNSGEHKKNDHVQANIGRFLII